MKWYTLDPPFDADLLKRISSNAWDRNWTDLSDTVKWVLEHQDIEHITALVKAAWDRCSLPLKEWAYRIEMVEVCATDLDVALRVSLVGQLDGDAPIYQYAPIEPVRLQKYVRDFPSPIPSIIRELALVAPGLTLEHSGEIAAPTYFMHRLGYITKWCKGVSVSQDTLSGSDYAYPNSDVYLMEVAASGLGNFYVMAKDQSLHFFDHEVPGLLPCSVTIDDFIAKYFESPEEIIDPFELGWATPGL